MDTPPPLIVGHPRPRPRVNSLLDAARRRTAHSTGGDTRKRGCHKPSWHRIASARLPPQAVALTAANAAVAQSLIINMPMEVEPIEAAGDATPTEPMQLEAGPVAAAAPAAAPPPAAAPVAAPPTAPPAGAPVAAPAVQPAAAPTAATAAAPAAGARAAPAAGAPAATAAGARAAPAAGSAHVDSTKLPNLPARFFEGTVRFGALRANPSGGRKLPPHMVKVVRFDEPSARLPSDDLTELPGGEQRQRVNKVLSVQEHLNAKHYSDHYGYTDPMTGVQSQRACVTACVSAVRGCLLLAPFACNV
jgi:hypothetical protein